MRVEMQLLIVGVILGIVHIVLQSVTGTAKRGAKWNVGARDDSAVPLTGLAGRLERASKNYFETFPLFVAASVVVLAQSEAGGWGSLGAQIYIGARVVYIPLYALGIPVVRTLTWVVATSGIVIMLISSI